MSQTAMTSTAPANAQALPRIDGGTTRENTKRVTDDTKKIAFLFVLVGFSDLILLHRLTLTSYSVRGTRAQDRSTLAFALNSGIDFPGELRKTWFPN